MNCEGCGRVFMRATTNQSGAERPRLFFGVRWPLLLPNIGFLVLKIISRIARDRFLILFVELAAKLSRRSHPQRSGLDDCLLGNQSTGRDDRSRADTRTIENDRSHSDQ